MLETQKTQSTWETMISLSGIAQAIEGLGYRSLRSLKFRLVDTLRAFHEQEGEAAFVKGYDRDDLIRVLWNTEKDSIAPASRRRNLSSLRSSVNADLMALFRKGGNPEGVIISPENTFIPCEEAKNQTLEALKGLSGDGEGSLNPKRIGELLKGIQELLSRAQETRHGEMKVDAGALNEIQAVVRGLARDLGVGPADEGTEGVGSPGTEAGAFESGFPNEALPLADAELEEVEGDEEVTDEAYEAVEVVEEEEDEALEDAELEEAEGKEEVTDEAYEDVEVVEEEGEDALADTELEEAEGEEEVTDEAYEAVEVVEEEEDALEDTELEEAEGEEEITDDAYEDVEVVDGEGEAEEGATESGEGEGEDEDEQVLDGWNFLEDEPQGAREDPERRRILSEEFNTSLAAMDRFFNAYILVPEGLYPNVGRAISTEDDMEERMRLPAFYIGRFPVTNALFEVFVEKTGYTTMAEKEGYGTVYQGRYCRVKDERTGKQTLYCSSGIVSSRIRGACWYQPTGPGSTLRGRRNHPVVQVSLEDAMAFAAWTGKRLPTEQEWEAAMRTQEGFLYPWGNEWKKDACNVEETGVGETSNVDRFMANANTLGIADGLGNVLEWTMTVARGEDGNRRMARGAGWIAGNTASLLSGTAFSPKTHSNLLGFRCVAF